MVIHTQVNHADPPIQREKRFAPLLLGSDDCHLIAELGNKDIGLLRKDSFHSPGVVKTVNDIDYLHFTL